MRCRITLVIPSLLLGLWPVAAVQAFGPEPPPVAVPNPAPPPVAPAKVAPGSNLGASCGSYYPAASRRLNESGAVVLLVFIDPTGRVSSTKIETSSGFPRLDEAAAKCVTEAGRFVPQLVGGTPVGSWQRMKWTWKLDYGELPPEVAAAFQPILNAIKQGDYDTALTLSKTALTAAKTSQDRNLALRVLLNVTAKKQDYLAYATYAEQLLGLGMSLPDQERVGYYKALAQIHGQAKNYEAALGWSEKWAEASKDAEAYLMVAKIHLVQQKDAAAIPWLEKSLAATPDPKEATLNLLYGAYIRSKDATAQRTTLEKLLAKYPKNDYLVALTALYASDAEPHALVDLTRLLVERNALPLDGDDLRFATAAMEVGAPAEALKVLELAQERNVLKPALRDESRSALLAQAKKRVAEEQKRLQTPDKPTRDVPKGEADVRIGLAHLDNGDVVKAIDALERGLRPDRIAAVQRVDAAYMALGIARLHLGLREQALDAFRKASSDSRMEHAAAMWIASMTTLDPQSVDAH
jgi:TonB family protein